MLRPWKRGPVLPGQRLKVFLTRGKNNMVDQHGKAPTKAVPKRPKMSFAEFMLWTTGHLLEPYSAKLKKSEQICGSENRFLTMFLFKFLSFQRAENLSPLKPDLRTKRLRLRRTTFPVKTCPANGPAESIETTLFGLDFLLTRELQELKRSSVNKTLSTVS